MRRMPPPITVMPPEYRGDLSQAWINLADQPLKEAYAAVRDFRIPWFNPRRLWLGPHPSPTTTRARQDFWTGLILGLIAHFLSIFALLGVTRVLGLSWLVSWIITGTVLFLSWYCLYSFWLGAEWRKHRDVLQDRLASALRDVDTDRAVNLKDALCREIDRLCVFAAEKGSALNRQATGSLADLRQRLWTFPTIEGTSTHHDKIKAMLRRVDSATTETIEDYRVLRASTSHLGTLADAWHTERSLDVRRTLEQKLNEGVMAILARVRSHASANETLLCEGYSLIGSSAVDFGPSPAPNTVATSTITN